VGEAFNLMRWDGGQGGALGLSCQETFWLERKNAFVAGGKENRSQTGENKLSEKFMGREIDGLLDSPWRDELGTDVAKGELRFREPELENGARSTG
jgi:hypothetical protein